MKQELIERIESIARDNERSTRAFELKIGISSGYLYQMKKNKGNIGIDVITNIIETYPDYNLEWLVSGKGEKYREKNYEVHEESASYKNIDENTSTKILLRKMDDLQYTINRRFIELEEGALKTALLEIADNAIKADQILAQLKSDVR